MKQKKPPRQFAAAVFLFALFLTDMPVITAVSSCPFRAELGYRRLPDKIHFRLRLFLCF
jgi:hypothetical protein